MFWRRSTVGQRRRQQDCPPSSHPCSTTTPLREPLHRTASSIPGSALSPASSHPQRLGFLSQLIFFSPTPSCRAIIDTCSNHSSHLLHGYVSHCLLIVSWICLCTCSLFVNSVCFVSSSRPPVYMSFWPCAIYGLINSMGVYSNRTCRAHSTRDSFNTTMMCTGTSNH